MSKIEASQAMQRLSMDEEDAIPDWMLELTSWGWPVRVEKLRGMALELLKENGDTKKLRIRWTKQYMHRYPILKMKYISGLDKDRATAQDPIIIAHWFGLFPNN